MEAEKRLELVVAADGWEEAVQALTTRPAAVAVSRLRRNQTRLATELLAAEFKVAERVPQGGDLPPVTDWVVLVHAAAQPAVSPADWVARLQPRPAQLLVVAVVGIGADQSGWDGLVVHGSDRQVLAAIRVIGPGMLRADRRTDEDVESEQAALARWSRARGALGDPVWRQVRNAHVALFGASRTGSILAFQLAALGVGRLLLCDPDTLESHNLDSMPGVTENDVGTKKVAALARRLVQFRSDLFVQGLACSAADAQVADRVRAADLLVTCVDSDTARLAAAQFASRLMKIHLDLGTAVTRGPSGEPSMAADIRLLVPGQGCVSCVGGLPDEAQARYDLSAPPGSLLRSQRRPWHEQRAGSLITLNTMAVSIAVQLWLDLLGGQLQGSHWTRLRWHPGRGLEVQEGAVTGQPDCRVCGRGAAGGDRTS